MRWIRIRRLSISRDHDLIYERNSSIMAARSSTVFIARGRFCIFYQLVKLCCVPMITIIAPLMLLDQEDDQATGQADAEAEDVEDS